MACRWVVACLVSGPNAGSELLLRIDPDLRAVSRPAGDSQPPDPCATCWTPISRVVNPNGEWPAVGVAARLEMWDGSAWRWYLSDLPHSLLRMPMWPTGDFALTTVCDALAVRTPLRLLPQLAGLTRAALAERSGTMQSAVAHVEEGHQLSLVNLRRTPLGCDVRLTIAEWEAV